MIIKIRDDKDHEAALDRIDQLLGAKKDTPQGDELEHLIALVDRFETLSEPEEYADPVAAILFRVEQAGLSRKDLEEYIGPKSRVSEILNGKRSLTIDMIRRLHRGLGIPLESLIFGNDSLELTQRSETVSSASAPHATRAH